MARTRSNAISSKSEPAMFKGMLEAKFLPSWAIKGMDIMCCFRVASYWENFAIFFCKVLLKEELLIQMNLLVRV